MRGQDFVAFKLILNDDKLSLVFIKLQEIDFKSTKFDFTTSSISAIHIYLITFEIDKFSHIVVLSTFM